jgi:hypothetical protein
MLKHLLYSPLTLFKVLAIIVDVLVLTVIDALVIYVHSLFLQCYYTAMVFLYLFSM